MLKERRFLNTIIIIAFIAFISTLPFLVFFQICHVLNLAYDTLGFKIAQKIFTCLLKVNFAVNPLIYVIRLSNYRKTCFLLFCKRLS